MARREVGRRGCSAAESATEPPDLVADLRGSGDPWRAPDDPMRAAGTYVAPTRARADRGGGGGVNQAARALRLVAEEVNASHNTVSQSGELMVPRGAVTRQMFLVFWCIDSDDNSVEFDPRLTSSGAGKD